MMIILEPASTELYNDILKFLPHIPPVLWLLPGTRLDSIKEMLNGKLCDLLSETGKQCYIKETLASLAHSPNQLAVDKANTLYFSFDSGQGDYSAAALKIDTKKLTVLKGIRDAFAIANDKMDTYFGGSHGIYKYNSIAKTLKRLRVSLDVWWLVIKKRLYFIKFPSLKTYYYANRTVKAVPELRHDVINQFVFDGGNNIIFINSTGLYGVKNGEDKAVLLKDYPKFLSIAVDNSGSVYLSNEHGIYVISDMVHKMKKIASVSGVLGMSFDKDNNIIYSDSQELVRLKLVNKTSF